MKQVIFSELMVRKARTKKWLFLPLSFMIHAVMMAALVVGPFLDAGIALPELQVLGQVKLVAEPPIPSVMAGKKGSSNRRMNERRREEQQDRQRTLDTGRLVAPVDVPEEIDEEPFDAGFDVGGSGLVEGGIDNGLVEGIDGGVGKEFLESTQSMERFTPVRIKEARLIHEVTPYYPETAKRARIQGQVIVEAVTDVYGRVVQTRLITGHPLLSPAALDAVKKWRYEPHVINGIPKPVVFTVKVNFYLQQQ